MRSLCSWVLFTCLLASTSLIAQTTSDEHIIEEGMEGQQLEEYDSLLEDEMALLLERWEDQADESSEERKWTEWFVELEGERKVAQYEYQRTERELGELEAQNQGLVQRQGELVGLIRDLIMEEEPSLLDDSLEDSIPTLYMEEQQESIRLYEEELSLVEQALNSKEVSIRSHLNAMDSLRDQLYELETEMEDIEMIHTPMGVLTTIDEE